MTNRASFPRPCLDPSLRLAPPVQPVVEDAALARIGGDGRLDALLESETAALAVLDTAGRIVRANRGFAALPRLARTVLCGMVPGALFVAEDEAAVSGAIADAVAGRAAMSFEARLRASADDPDAAVEIHCRPLRGEPGALLRLHDATERRQLQSQLAATGRMQAVGQLAGGVAHDFNNLLATIGAAAEASLARDTSADTASDLTQILDSVARGARLVRQLLAFASAQPLQPRVLDLAAAIAAAEPLLQRLVGGRVRLELALDRAVAPVRLDPGQVDQILLNLVANARDAMEAGGRLRIALRAAVLGRALPGAAGPVPAGRWVQLEVADEGTGMPPDVQRRVFEPFFTTRRGQGGTGLGLSTVLGAVRQSGGHLSLRSREGQGTAFRIWFPPAEGEVVVADAPAVAAAAARPGLRVLLVEDEAPLRRLARRALEGAGHVVIEAADAEAAMAAMADAVPDVLISDIVLGGGGDGLALARALRDRCPGLAVVLVSGYAEGVLGHDLDAAGFQFIAKPFRMADLIAQAAQALAAAKPDLGLG